MIKQITKWYKSTIFNTNGHENHEHGYAKYVEILHWKMLRQLLIREDNWGMLHFKLWWQMLHYIFM